MVQTIYLITGANRGQHPFLTHLIFEECTNKIAGIGYGLTKAYLARSHSTVIATVRNLHHPSTSALQQLPRSESSALILLKIESAVRDDPFQAVNDLQTHHNVTHLDVVIANAAIYLSYDRAADVNPQAMLEHYAINVVGPLNLFQAVRPLLLRSSHPKFITMSSSAGSIGAMELRPTPNAAYGPSKAALNYLTRKIHFEDEAITAFPLDPGWVQTDLGERAGIEYGIPSGPETSLEDSVLGLAYMVRGFIG